MKTKSKQSKQDEIFKVDIKGGVIFDQLFERTSITYNQKLYNEDGTRRKEYYGRYYLNKEYR